MDRELLESCYTPAALGALEKFPIEPDRVELIAHAENVTFRVSVRDADSDYVLRLHRPGYNSLEELESERTWAQALKAAGISVPESLRTREGRYFERVDIPGTDERRHAGVSTWHEGTLLGDYLDATADADERRRLFRRVGEMAAAIHNQSAGWQPPSGFTRRRLDLHGLLGESPLWGRFWEHADLTRSERDSLLQARERSRSLLAAYGERPDNFSLIHADLHPHNIVHNGDDLVLIDFDDSAYGWHVYDIAAALIEYVFEPDFDALRGALLEGYRQTRPLSRRDTDMLPVFLLVRGMAIIGWFHQRPEHAGSDFFEDVKKWVLEGCASGDWNASVGGGSGNKP